MVTDNQIKLIIKKAKVYAIIITLVVFAFIFLLKLSSLNQEGSEDHVYEPSYTSDEFSNSNNDSTETKTSTGSFILDNPLFIVLILGAGALFIWKFLMGDGYYY